MLNPRAKIIKAEFEIQVGILILDSHIFACSQSFLLNITIINPILVLYEIPIGKNNIYVSTFMVDFP